MTVLAGTPTHRISVTREFRLDESATAVITAKNNTRSHTGLELTALPGIIQAIDFIFPITNIYFTVEKL